METSLGKQPLSKNLHVHVQVTSCMSRIMVEYVDDGGDGSMDVYDMHYAKGVMTIVYITVFLIGTPGNLWIIYKLIQARLLSTHASVGVTISQRSRIYIFALACSDLVLLLTLPLTASYNYKGTWMFGEFMCYAHLTIEIVAKLFSVVLLTVVSLERYFIVCTRLRTACGSWMTTVPLVVGTLFCVIVPSTFHFFHIIHHTFTIPGMDHITVCIPNMDDHVFNMYAQYTFVVGFVIPFFLMTVCYILLVRHVRAKFRHRKVTVSSTKGIREPRYMHEMRKSIWRIAVFHFICWAPFWTFAIVPHYIAQLWGHDFLERLPGWYIYCRLFANCLPYINAAGNWVLYALLNYDVRKHIYNKPYQRFLFSSLSTV
ncbi:7 transmembrane receptor [Ancylostoma ceylanicum]|uniref:7 transmembrane receptor n=2 Tax=Ancylostoma ceylanicum TaxID=53326 RepID=A0A0D6M292_9BILA|nr:7 transmembrane receptor [Ancylostoma ceylanicum]